GARQSACVRTLDPMIYSGHRINGWCGLLDLDDARHVRMEAADIGEASRARHGCPPALAGRHRDVEAALRRSRAVIDEVVILPFDDIAHRRGDRGRLEGQVGDADPYGLGLCPACGNQAEETERERRDEPTTES